MPTLLDSLGLKMKRAEDHFKHFQDAVFRNPEMQKTAHIPGFKHDSDRQRIVAAPQYIPEIDHEWGVILGDVFHQLRASLDHMLYALARKPLTAKEERSLHFPIFENSLDFSADWRVSQNFWAPVVGSVVFAELKLSQPYERYPAAPTSDPLWLLHKLDVIDKHRTILVLANRWSLRGAAWDKQRRNLIPFDSIFQPVKPGAEVFSFEWPDSSPPSEVYVQHFSPDVVFDGTDGLCDGTLIVPTVRRMFDAVVEIVDGFKRFF
jgi:hypothetical protein